MRVANTTVGMGGAIWHKAGSLKIRWGVFSGNTAGAYYESIGGGAISQTGGQLLLSDCTFVSNSTTGHGGAVSKAVYPAPYGEWASPGPGTIERCVFIDNEAGANRYGGAIAFGAFSNYSGRVQNSVFRGNSAGKGGAISTENAHVALSNITAAGNASVMTGYGGTLAHDSPQHSATVVNSIFWDNGTTEIEPTIGVSVSYSDVQDGFAGTGNLDADPRFVDLVYLHLKSTTGQYTNGYFDGGRWATGDAMSPCIDAGDPASDASYEPRPRSGRINLGAYGNTAVASKAIPTGIVIMIR